MVSLLTTWEVDVRTGGQGSHFKPGDVIKDAGNLMVLNSCFSGARPPPSIAHSQGQKESVISTKHLEFSIVHDWCPSLAMMGVWVF